MSRTIQAVLTDPDALLLDALATLGGVSLSKKASEYIKRGVAEDASVLLNLNDFERNILEQGVARDAEQARLIFFFTKAFLTDNPEQFKIEDYANGEHTLNS